MNLNNPTLKIVPNVPTYLRIGVREIVGLENALCTIMQPVFDAVLDKAYWTDAKHAVNSVEYQHRDGFIPHSNNLGGIELFLVVPKWEKYTFSILEFGECDTPKECEPECICERDGHLDAAFRIRLKFEGIDDETGALKFYLFAEGGNDDAPYFRKLPTLFEAEFTVMSIREIGKAAGPSIRKLLKLIEGM